MIFEINNRDNTQTIIPYLYKALASFSLHNFQQLALAVLTRTPFYFSHNHCRYVRDIAYE